ncbi:MAG: sulfatase-like hydrolase/transferase [Planctomycetota bacterium]
MMYRPVLALLLLGLLGLVESSAASTVRTPRNVVIIIADDMGWNDVSPALQTVPTPSHAHYRTPNLERLALRGVRFSDAYASSHNCAPSRAALLTGRNPAASRITFTPRFDGRPRSRPHPRLRLPVSRSSGIDPVWVTLPAALPAHRSVHVGKAHFGPVGSPVLNPLALGFDRSIGAAVSNVGSYLGTDGFVDPVQGPTDPKPAPHGLDAFIGTDIYLTDALSLVAAREIEHAAAEGEPLLLLLALYAPHTPVTANPRHVDPASTLPPLEAAYDTMIRSIDDSVGTVLDALERLQMLDDTLIIFTSDNGGDTGPKRTAQPVVANAPLRSGKSSGYEGGVRVPLIIAGPDVARGAVSDIPVMATDLFPTILDFLDAPPPPQAGAREGWSLLPLLVPEGPDPTDAAAWAQRPLFWHSPHAPQNDVPGAEPQTVIRQGPWKLLYFHDGPRFELYNLRRDIAERRNVARDRPQRVRALAEAMQTWLGQVNAQMPRTHAGPVVPGPLDALTRE